MKKIKLMFSVIMVMVVSMSAIVCASASYEEADQYYKRYTYTAWGAYSDFYAAGNVSSAYTVLTNKDMEIKKLSVQVREYEKGKGWTQSSAKEVNCRYGAQATTDDISRDWLSDKVYYFHSGTCSEVNYNRRYDDFTYKAMQY